MGVRAIAVMMRVRMHSRVAPSGSEATQIRFDFVSVVDILLGHRSIILFQTRGEARRHIFSFANIEDGGNRIENSVGELLVISMFVLEVIFVPSGDEALLQVEDLNLFTVSGCIMFVRKQHRMNICASVLVKIICRMCKVIRREIISILIETVHEDDFNMTRQ